MAYRCNICGKGPQVAYSVSHSNRKTKRRQLPNLHRKKIKIEGKVETWKVCTRCLRSGKVTLAA